MNTQAVMISCEQRTQTREETLAQLPSALNTHAILSPCDPAGPPENNRVSTLALHYAYSTGKNLLFVEDDLTIGDPEWFMTALSMAEQVGQPTYLFLNDLYKYMDWHYAPNLKERILAGQGVQPRLYPIRNPTHMFGTQCVYLPYRLYANIVENYLLQSTQQSFDVFLSMYLEKSTKEWTPLVALPHPVQHRHVRVARKTQGRDFKYSRSYGQPHASTNDPPKKHATHAHFYASNENALTLLKPLWQALPYEHRGNLYYPQGNSNPDVPPEGPKPPRGTTQPIIVTARRDAQTLKSYPRVINLGETNDFWKDHPHVRIPRQERQNNQQIGLYFSTEAALAGNTHAIRDIQTHCQGSNLNLIALLAKHPHDGIAQQWFNKYHLTTQPFALTLADLDGIITDDQQLLHEFKHRLGIDLGRGTNGIRADIQHYVRSNDPAGRNHAELPDGIAVPLKQAAMDAARDLLEVISGQD